MIETIKRRVAGCDVEVRLCGCESCGWLWLCPVTRLPTRCAKCDTRRWNTSQPATRPTEQQASSAPRPTTPPPPAETIRDTVLVPFDDA